MDRCRAIRGKERERVERVEVWQFTICHSFSKP